MEYSVYDLIRILLKKWYVILLVMALLGGAAGVFSQRSYQAALADYEDYTSRAAPVNTEVGSYTAVYQCGFTVTDFSRYQGQYAQKNAFINGVSHSLDTPAVAVNGRTMVPVRFVAESLDCKVYWDSYNQLVSIFTDNADAAAYAAELQKQQAARKAEEERLAAQRAAQKAEQERLAAQNKNTQTVSKKSTTVYVTPTGERYHYSGSCNGGTYIASTLEKALARGLTPCKKCVG